MHGSQVANQSMAQADLVLALGARFSDRVIGLPDGFCPKAKLVQFDIDVNELGKNMETHFPVCGDLKEALRAFKDYLGPGPGYLKPVRQSKDQTNYDEKGPLKPQVLLEKIHKAFGNQAIVATEVGQNQMWTAQYFGFERTRQFLTSGGLGTMGYGLGAAIGAQVGNPQRQLIHIAGDGSFKMNCNELGTVSKYKLPLKTFILNNNALGMVRQWQQLFCNNRFSETMGDDSVDFVKLGQAYGIKSYRVSTLAELDAVLEEIKDLAEPILVDCILLPEENVYPIVPPGRPITQMITQNPVDVVVTP
jgi:acetolactate synthase-1/2/3 large subunit